MNQTNMFQPALISGLIFGVLTAIPPFSLINLCSCCSLYAAAGVLAAWLYRRSAEGRLTPGTGAILGAGTGLVGGTCHAAISLPLAFILQNLGSVAGDGLAERISEILGPQNAEVAEILRKLLENSRELSIVFILVKLISSIFFFSLFACLGGILASALFKNRPTLPPYQQAPILPPNPIPPPPIPVVSSEPTGTAPPYDQKKTPPTEE